MKKPVKKAVKPARKRIAVPARPVLQAKGKAPSRPVRPVVVPSKARKAKARPQAMVIPPILLETVPPPAPPLIVKSKPVEPQRIVQENIAKFSLPHAVAPLPPSPSAAIPEPVAVAPSLVETAMAPFPLIPANIPAPFPETLEPGFFNQPARMTEQGMERPEPAVAVEQVPQKAPSIQQREPERGVLRLLARDPHWLFAAWFFPAASLEGHRLRSADGRLHLKVQAQEGQGEDIALTLEAREWFIPVPNAGTTYHVEMGYRNQAGAWVSVADPATASTPAEAPAAPAAAQMRTVVFVPAEAAPPAFWNTASVKKPAPYAETKPAPRITIAAEVPWISETQASLEKLNAPSRKTQVPVAAQSLHLAAPERELKPPMEVPPPLGLPVPIPSSFALPSSPQPGQLLSELAGAAPGRGFWFTVNAELIIYGATEPNASVEIAGKPIRLRPDGGFSFRFALPDGHYELPVAALSADGAEFRGAVLQFERNTRTVGAVGVHPQDPHLKKPVPASGA